MAEYVGGHGDVAWAVAVQNARELPVVAGHLEDDPANMHWCIWGFGTMQSTPTEIGPI